MAPEGKDEAAEQEKVRRQSDQPLGRRHLQRVCVRLVDLQRVDESGLESWIDQAEVVWAVSEQRTARDDLRQTASRSAQALLSNAAETCSVTDWFAEIAPPGLSAASNRIPDRTPIAARRRSRAIALRLPASSTTTASAVPSQALRLNVSRRASPMTASAFSARTRPIQLFAWMSSP